MQIIPKSEFADYLGKEVGVSDWIEIDQKRIDAFADATLDHQFIHVDPKAAAQTPFGGTIAHGFLTLSLMPHLVAAITLIPENLSMAVNYGCDKLRFLEPVKVDSRIRARAKLLEATERPGGQLLVKSEVTIEIDGARRPALVADMLALFFTR